MKQSALIVLFLLAACSQKRSDSAAPPELVIPEYSESFLSGQFAGKAWTFRSGRAVKDLKNENFYAVELFDVELKKPCDFSNDERAARSLHITVPNASGEFRFGLETDPAKQTFVDFVGEPDMISTTQAKVLVESVEKVLLKGRLAAVADAQNILTGKFSATLCESVVEDPVLTPTPTAQPTATVPPEKPVPLPTTAPEVDPTATPVVTPEPTASPTTVPTSLPTPVPTISPVADTIAAKTEMVELLRSNLNAATAQTTCRAGTSTCSSTRDEAFKMALSYLCAVKDFTFNTFQREFEIDFSGPCFLEMVTESGKQIYRGSFSTTEMPWGSKITLWRDQDDSVNSHKVTLSFRSNGTQLDFLFGRFEKWGSVAGARNELSNKMMISLDAKLKTVRFAEKFSSTIDSPSDIDKATQIIRYKRLLVEADVTTGKLSEVKNIGIGTYNKNFRYSHRNGLIDQVEDIRAFVGNPTDGYRSTSISEHVWDSGNSRWETTPYSLPAYETCTRGSMSFDCSKVPAMTIDSSWELSNAYKYMEVPSQQLGFSSYKFWKN